MVVVVVGGYNDEVGVGGLVGEGWGCLGARNAVIFTLQFVLGGYILGLDGWLNVVWIKQQNNNRGKK